MGRITQDLAFRLKDAGFPQPDPEVGQQWFQPEEHPIKTPYTIYSIYRGRAEPKVYLFNAGRNDYSEIQGNLFAYMAYAPSAEEIMQNMKPWHIVYRNGRFYATDLTPTVGPDNVSLIALLTDLYEKG